MEWSASLSPDTIGFAEKPAFRVVRLLFPFLSAVAPGLAARVALRLFLTPQRYEMPLWERPHFQSARMGTLKAYGKAFKTYAWGAGARTIVLCHSWGGRGTQLGSFVPPLLRRGFRVVAFDAPAHGASDGGQTDMMEYSSAVAEVVSHFGPVHGLLGHSFGAGSALLAWQRFGFEVERVALVGCFSNAVWVTERFGEMLGIPARTVVAMRRLLEERHRGELDWGSLVIGEMARAFPGELMLVHDRSDFEIPYFHAEHVLAASGRTADAVLTTTGLGHRRIVRNKTVIDTVGEFFARRGD